jgi:hypothetical protein
VVIPGGVAYNLATAGTDPAVMMGVSVRPANMESRGEVMVDPRHGDAAALEPARELTGWPLGAAVERVASWSVAAVPSDSASLAAGWLRLEPGARLELATEAGPVLLAVAAGTLVVAAAVDELAGPGERVSLAPGTTVELSTSVAVPVSALMFALIPDQA